MRIGYGKIGRSFNLDRSNLSTLGGDIDVLNVLTRLAQMYPNDEIVLIGRNSGEIPSEVGLPANITNPWRDVWKPLQADLRAAGCEVSLSRTGKSKQLSLEAELIGLPIFKRYVEWMSSGIDTYVLWLGQHGTSNWPIPMTDGTGTLTHPQDAFYWYAGHIIHAVNTWRDKSDGQFAETWLNPDPRNYLKCRDLKWPVGTVLGQFDYTYRTKHERYGDPREAKALGYDGDWDHSTWAVKTRGTYAGVELTAIDPLTPLFPGPDLDGRQPFGMIINENRKEVTNARLDVMRMWVSPMFSPDIEIFGSWSAASQDVLGRKIEPLPHNEAQQAMGRWRSTFTTPASGSGWATAKFWEAAAQNTVCFMHPGYDTQNHILKQLEPDERSLHDWLRVESPEQLRKRVDAVMRDDDAYQWLAATQRRLLDRAMTQDRVGSILRERIETRRRA